MTSVTKDLPRRVHMEMWTMPERAIHAAMQAVEGMPADVRLTHAVIKLAEAKSLVADFVDEGLRAPSIAVHENQAALKSPTE